MNSQDMLHRSAHVGACARVCQPLIRIIWDPLDPTVGSPCTADFYAPSADQHPALDCLRLWLKTSKRKRIQVKIIKKYNSDQIPAYQCNHLQFRQNPK